MITLQLQALALEIAAVSFAAGLLKEEKLSNQEVGDRTPKVAIIACSVTGRVTRDIVVQSELFATIRFERCRCAVLCRQPSLSRAADHASRSHRQLHLHLPESGEP